MAFYDNMIDKPEYHRDYKGYDFFIVLMPPHEYLKYVEMGFKAPFGSSIQQTFSKITQKYSDLMKKGSEFPMLTLDYTGNRFTQEGRNRALAAMKANIKYVPVMVAFEKEDKDKMDLLFLPFEKIPLEDV